MKLHRADGLLTDDLLQSVNLAIIGCGSVGSDIVANLPYNFGKVILVDPDTLGPENIERHVLGLNSVGKPKVIGLRDFLADKGVDPNSIIAIQDQAQNVLADLDITHVILAVDDPYARRLLHQIVTDRKLNCLTIGIYPKGTAGHVIVVPGGSHPCGMCGEMLLGFDESAYAPNVHDYGLGTAGDLAPKANVAIPALHAAVEAIANMAARVMLDMIRGEVIPPQIMIHANSAWEPVLALDQNRPEVEKLVNWLAVQRKLGLIGTMRLQASEPGTLVLQIRNTTISLSLERHNLCPFHNLVDSDQV